MMNISRREFGQVAASLAILPKPYFKVCPVGMRMCLLILAGIVHEIKVRDICPNEITLSTIYEDRSQHDKFKYGWYALLGNIDDEFLICKHISVNFNQLRCNPDEVTKCLRYMVNEEIGRGFSGIEVS